MVLHGSCLRGVGHRAHVTRCCAAVSGDKGRCGCAALRVHHQVSVRGAHGLQVSALAGECSACETAGVWQLT